MRARAYSLWAILSLLLLWQGAAWLLPDFLLPDVAQVLGRALRSAGDGAFLAGLRQSLLRLGVGYLLACGLGAALGIAAGLSRGLAAYLRALIAVLQSIPPITWVPFLVILFGFGDLPIVTIIAMAGFYPMALSVMNAAAATDRTYLEVARVLGASRWQQLWKVYGPAALPGVVTGAQVAFGNAWRSLIAGEMVGGVASGLGWSISYAGEIADMEGVLAGIAVIGTLAVCIDHFGLERLKRRLLHWQLRTAGGDLA